MEEKRDNQYRGRPVQAVLLLRLFLSNSLLLALSSPISSLSSLPFLFSLTLSSFSEVKKIPL